MILNCFVAVGEVCSFAGRCHLHNMPLYLGDGSDNCIYSHTAEVADQTCYLTQSPSHSILTLGEPVLVLTQSRQEPDKVACRLSVLSNIWIYVMGCVCPAGTKFIVGHYTQTLEPFFFSYLTIDFYHFTPLSLALTSPGGHKVSTKQNLLSSFLAHFSNDQGEI